MVLERKLLLIVLTVVVLALLTFPAAAQQPTNTISQSRDVDDKPCVIVYGAVRSPSRFELHRPVRLSEAITLAGGVTASASPDVQVVHGGHWSCAPEQSHPTSRRTSRVVPEVHIFKLTELVGEDESANPYLQSGDSVLVVELPLVYVVGNVMSPQGMVFVPDLTVTKAITVAGGVLRYSNTKRIRIIRDSPNPSVMTEIVVDWDSIRKHRLEDIVLEPNDILEVPVKRGHEVTIGDRFSGPEPLPVRIVN